MTWNNLRKTITDDEAVAMEEVAALAVQAAEKALGGGATGTGVAVLAAALVRRYPV